MKLSTFDGNPHFPFTTWKLAQRMLSPLCGFDQRIGLVGRGRLEPRFVVGGAELTGIHVLLDRDEPGSYHIGGTGIMLHEAMMRALGESVERYSQFVSVLANRLPIVKASYEEMAESGHAIPPPESFQYFSEEAYASPRFRFQPFTQDAPLGWVEAHSLIDDSRLWVPAQLVLVGYQADRHGGEPWLIPAVTTGTAAHTTPKQALQNALLELVQIDAAIGHWYSPATAPRIDLDARTVAVKRIIERHFDPRRPLPSFYWISSADLPGLIVACILKAPPGQVPAVAIGLGADTRLTPALYKAMLEAVGSMQLAKVNLVSAIASGQPGDQTIDPDEIFDLDLNVAYYADPTNTPVINEKFVADESIGAMDLPADTEPQIESLVDAFAATGKTLVYLDLTTDDIRELGLVVARVWSPDTLSLPLPSAPPVRHPRFDAYGGASNHNPHPYP